jgi:tripartite-type tricarboxylate transporter receptor subunit TctC
MHIRRLLEMFRPVRGFGAALLAFIAFAALSAAAVAQPYPNKPVRVFVPYPPGGGTDVLARIVAPKLSENLGQQVVIDNRPGAGGTLGSAIAARAPADGYNLLILNTLPHTSAAGLYAKLGYDPVKDFTAVGMVAATPYVLAVHPSVPANTLAEFIALARARPGALNYASAGTGSATHLAAELFKSVTKVNLTHIPYKGGGPGISDLLGGQVQLTFENILALMPHIKAGKLRALAVTSRKRSLIFPDLPTVAEAGYPDFDVVGQFGFVVPAGVPREIIAQLNAELTKAMKSPELVNQLNSQGSEPRTSTPEEFDAIIRAESAKWLAVIRDAGIKVE